MAKVKKLYTRKRYIVKSEEIKKAFGIENGVIVHFGLWKGRSPAMEQQGIDPDKHDEWYIEVNEET